MKLKRKLIIYKNRVFSYVPKDILDEIGFDENKNYEVEWWIMGNTNVLCMKLVEV